MTPPVRRLGSAGRERFLAHLLALPADDIRLRFGTALLARASEHARNRHRNRLYMHCLAENAAMMRIARRAGMSIVIDTGEADAHLALPPANPASVTNEFITDQLALFDFALKTHVDALKRATDAVKNG